MEQVARAIRNMYKLEQYQLSVSQPTELHLEMGIHSVMSTVDYEKYSSADINGARTS